MCLRLSLCVQVFVSTEYLYSVAGVWNMTAIVHVYRSIIIYEAEWWNTLTWVRMRVYSPCTAQLFYS